MVRIASSLFLLSALISAVYGLGYKVSTKNKNWDYDYPYQPARFGSKGWYYGSATFYDWMGNSGACGLPWAVVNKVDTAAVPPPRYQNLLTNGVANVDGGACGQCYWLKCLEVPRYGQTVFCKTRKSVLVTVVDYDVPGTWGDGQWPNNHFDLKPSTFNKLAHLGAGIVNLKFKRGYCRSRIPKWTLGAASNPFWKDVIVYQVPASGAVTDVWAKPTTRKKWYQGKRLWGAHFTFLGGWAMDSSTKVLVTLAENQGSYLAMNLQRT